MKIKDVQIDGFGVWSGLTVHSMADTMTVFYGPNEAGKTTLMQFLRTMFYGFTTDRKTRYLPPVYGGKPGGAIRVTGPGGGYEITRRSQLDGTGNSTGSLTVTGSDGLSQGQHRLAMLLGQVDESIFTNVFAIGLRELQELSTLDDTAAADELYKLSSGLDRVSLVDVTRKLRSARADVVGPTPEDGQVQKLLAQREKLKEEIEREISSSRRWNELASLRATQNGELDELKQRIEQWELEAKTYEVAIQVRPNWIKRLELNDQIAALGARTEIPDSVAGRLAEINEEIAEREEKLAETKGKRRELRETARKLPLRRGILDLAAKIEAASEQTPWINSLQKNVQRLEGQIDETREQLLEDAKRLGMSEEDQEALLDDRRLASMPDLSRQAINQLAEPASEVRLWSNRLKQSKQQIDTEGKESERLQKELEEALQNHGRKDIQAALKENAASITLLRKRQQVQETLDRQLSRRKQLEEEAVDLTVDEALPVERSFMTGLMFIGGGFFFVWGVGVMTGFFGETYDPMTGLLLVMGGFFLMLLFFVYSNVLDRGTVSELEDVEDQIDAVRKEIRRTEDQRDELERQLPASNNPLDIRIRDCESEIASLESLLPVQHNLAAVQDRHKTARRKASQASEQLKTARAAWQRTLTQLGLADSLSPKSVRIMAEGYDSLLQSRKRLQSLEQELETRELELGAITQRIDSLSKQVFAAKAASDALADPSETHEDDEFESMGEEKPIRTAVAHDGQADAKPVRADTKMADAALSQLTRLTALVSSQEQYIFQKKSLREQDQQLSKQCAQIQKTIDKLFRKHSSVLAEHGCESEEQVHELLGLKAKHAELSEKVSEFGERIVSVIGASVPYETIQRLLDSPGSDELEKRWEQILQRTQQAETRVEQLHTRQGELAQEMKSLATNTRLAAAKLELSCVENQLKSCAEHWRVLATTTTLLDRVCEVYETERQPETLREASAFLTQLTEGKYTRIWTPLGKNQLRIDNGKGQSLPLEVLSRGTREAVFIALRLSLAAAYARRGITIPLVLDDVLVNFDSIRAEAAARVLRDFAGLGHQVVMFTCHEHIMRIFDSIGVQVRVLPPQGQPGEADVYYPEALEAPEPVEVIEPEPVAEPEETVSEVVEEITEVVEEELAEPPPPTVKNIVVVEDAAAEEPDIDWLWYERDESPVDEIVEEWTEPVDDSSAEPPADELWWKGKATNEAKAS